MAAIGVADAVGTAGKVEDETGSEVVVIDEKTPRLLVDEQRTIVICGVESLVGVWWLGRKPCGHRTVARL